MNMMSELAQVRHGRVLNEKMRIGGKLVGGYVTADQLHPSPAPGEMLRDTGHIHGDQIHGDIAAEGAGASGDENLARGQFLAALAARACGARVPIRIADGERGDPPASERQPAGVVADGVVFLDPAELHDARLEPDDDNEADGKRFLDFQQAVAKIMSDDKKVYRVYSVIDKGKDASGKDRDPFWHNIGTGFIHGDSKGFNLLLGFLRCTSKFVLFPNRTL